MEQCPSEQAAAPSVVQTKRRIRVTSTWVTACEWMCLRTVWPPRHHVGVTVNFG